MRVRVVLLPLFVVVVGHLLGCSSGPAAATISGEVKVDGVPVAKGIITYSPADNTGAPATAEIRDGRYTLQTTAGPKRVQLSVPVVTDRRKESTAPDAPWVEITNESLPDRYHSSSTLTFEVQPGSNTKDWPLVVKAK